MSGPISFFKLGALLGSTLIFLLLLPVTIEARSGPTRRGSKSSGRMKTTDGAKTMPERSGKTPSKTPEKPSGKKNDRNYVLKTRITLGDGRVIPGTIRFRAPKKLTVRHIKDGVPYTRTIRITEIGRIENRAWKAEFLRRNRQGEVFQFDVSSFDLILKDKTPLHLQGALYPFLKRLQLQNDNGRVILYTYWIDLLRKDGTWYTGLPLLPGRIRKKCHRDVIRRIDFIPDAPVENPARSGLKD